MKIGELTLKPGRPDEAALAASCGVGPHEMHEMLGGFCLASTVAAALNACLKEPLDRHTLAVEIAKAGVDAVRPRVRRLYASAKAPVAAPAPAAHSNEGDGAEA